MCLRLIIDAYMQTHNIYITQSLPGRQNYSDRSKRIGEAQIDFLSTVTGQFFCNIMIKKYAPDLNPVFAN